MAAESELELLRAYVTAPGNSGAKRADSTVLLHVTHSNLKAEFMEIRFDLSCTIEEVKRKLAFHCGSGVAAMSLQLKDPRGGLVAELSDGARMLGYYSPQTGYVLHITDRDALSASANGWLEDVSKVPKYIMSDADYGRRENTYRRFKEAKLAQDASWTLEREIAQRQGRASATPASQSEEHSEQAASHVAVGGRCEVSPGGRRGTVRYCGAVDGLPDGVWVGVEYDEPLGRNDGSVNGKRLFDCRPRHGAFVRAGAVMMGAFSEVDCLSSDDEI